MEVDIYNCMVIYAGRLSVKLDVCISDKGSRQLFVPHDSRLSKAKEECRQGGSILSLQISQKGSGGTYGSSKAQSYEAQGGCSKKQIWSCQQ